MEIKYQQFENRFFEDLKQMTLGSFDLTSFSTDREMDGEKARLIPWEVWCRPVLLSEKKKYCIVAAAGRKAAGFIIYGAHAEYSRVLGRKAGSIILMAVEKKFRGKYRIAPHLIDHVMNIFRKNRVGLVTVGTDLDNLPALTGYINHGFRPVLSWVTLRRHLGKPEEDTDPSLLLEPARRPPSSDRLFDARPNPYLLDHKLPPAEKRRLKRHCDKSVREEIRHGRLNAYQLVSPEGAGAFVTVKKEEQISGILGKGFYRINDLHFFPAEQEHRVSLMKGMLPLLNGIYPDLGVLEVFVRANDRMLLNILIRSGFNLVHHAVNLHCHLR